MAGGNKLRVVERFVLAFPGTLLIFLWGKRGPREARDKIYRILGPLSWNKHNPHPPSPPTPTPDSKVWHLISANTVTWMKDKWLLVSQEKGLDSVCSWPYLFKVGSRICSSSITCKLIQNTASRISKLDGLNQNLHFDKVPLVQLGKLYTGYSLRISIVRKCASNISV